MKRLLLTVLIFISVGLMAQTPYNPTTFQTRTSKILDSHATRLDTVSAFWVNIMAHCATGDTIFIATSSDSTVIKASGIYLTSGDAARLPGKDLKNIYLRCNSDSSAGTRIRYYLER